MSAGARFLSRDTLLAARSAEGARRVQQVDPLERPFGNIRPPLSMTEGVFFTQSGIQVKLDQR
jgi:hypothetical protein